MSEKPNHNGGGEGFEALEGDNKKPQTPEWADALSEVKKGDAQVNDLLSELKDYSEAGDLNEAVPDMEAPEADVPNEKTRRNGDVSEFDDMN